MNDATTDEDETPTIITSVWSSFGHRFYSEDGHEACMTCGARFELRPREDDPTSGDYQANNGDDPTECSGDTGQCHGDAPCEANNGRPCQDNGQGEPCSHESHTCNCLLCAG